MGQIRYKAMIQHGGYDIVAICDSECSKLRGYPVKIYTDWKQCITQCKADAVIVCTYNAIISEIACYALEKGYAVFSEKPPGKNLQDTLSMKKAYENAERKILKFGFNHRYHNSVIEAKTLVDSKILGDVVCARGVYGKAGSLRFEREWRNNKDISGGGIMLDQGIHMLDLMYYFMGKFTNIQSSIDQLVWMDMPTEDSAFSILRTEDGKIASLHSSAIQWRHMFNLDLICTKGFISLNGLLTSSHSYGEEKITYYYKDLEQKTGRLGKPTEHTMCFDKDDSWNYEMQEFYDAVALNKPIEQGTIEDAVNLMEMVEEIYKGIG